MDTATVPIITARTTLIQAWQIMRERGCATVLLHKGNAYASFSDEIIAEGIKRGVHGFRRLSDQAKLIPVLTPNSFEKASKSVYSTRELGRILGSIDKAFSSLIGGTRRRVRTPNHFAQRLSRILDRSNLKIAVVGINFNAATIFSRSENDMDQAGIFRSAPGRYVCECDNSHFLQPNELFQGACPFDSCSVKFAR